MIKGNLKSVSVPSLLQMLANESHRAYRFAIYFGNQTARIEILQGQIIDARYGILEGVDALVEIITLSSGEFEIETFTAEERDFVRGTVRCSLEELGSFADQCCFLRQLKLGLNTPIVPSASFGQEDWQEALYIQPLGKFDYSVLGWITDGRTMRQAMSELDINLKQAIGILYRLILTSSVEIVRIEGASELDEDLDISGIVRKRLNKLASQKVPHQGATIVSIKDDKKSSDSKENPIASNVVPKKSASKRDTAENPVLPEKSIFEKDTDTQELPTVGGQIDESFAESILDSPLNRLVQKEVDAEEAKSEGKEPESEPEPEPEDKSISVGQSHFDVKKTDPLPLVSIDIERLLNTAFKLTAKGSEALNEESEDETIEDILRGVKLGKSLLLVLTDSNMSEASVMATYRYCLENDYIEHHDPVVSLTMDLLIDQMDLVQYLLQRRRITGDQLKELTSISKRQGIAIVKLLVGAGAVLTADLDRLKQEQERFAPK